MVRAVRRPLFEMDDESWGCRNVSQGGVRICGPFDRNVQKQGYKPSIYILFSFSFSCIVRFMYKSSRSSKVVADKDLWKATRSIWQIQ